MVQIVETSILDSFVGWLENIQKILMEVKNPSVEIVPFRSHNS